MSNRSIGDAFEQEFAEFLHANGFWVHLLKQRQSGQPADIIAVKGNKSYLFECKVCSKAYFPLTRIEDNQRCGCISWTNRVNSPYYFAIRLPSRDVYIVDGVWLCGLDPAVHQRVSEQELEQRCDYKTHVDGRKEC